MNEDRSFFKNSWWAAALFAAAISVGCQSGDQSPVTDAANTSRRAAGEATTIDVPTRADDLSQSTSVQDDAEIELRIANATNLVEAGKLLEARQEFAEIDAFEPGHAEANLELANLAVSLGDLAAAEARYQRVLQRKPNHIEAHERLAQLLSAQQQWDQAADHWRAVLTVHPGDGHARKSLAEIDANRDLR